MDSALARPLLIGLAAAAAVWLIFKFITLRANRPASNKGIIRYGNEMRVVVIFCGLMVTFISYAAWHAAADQRHIAYPLAIAFIVSTVMLAIEIFFIRFVIDGGQVTHFSPWRRTRVIRWDNIIDYKWSGLFLWHVFRTRDQGSIRLSPYLAGVNTFLRKAFSRLKEREPERYVALLHGTGNRAEIRKSKKCGCFHCLAVFPPQEIEEWVQKWAGAERTALCPRCNMDSVLGDKCGYPIDAASLAKVRAVHFGK